MTHGLSWPEKENLARTKPSSASLLSQSTGRSSYLLPYMDRHCTPSVKLKARLTISVHRDARARGWIIGLHDVAVLAGRYREIDTCVPGVVSLIHCHASCATAAESNGAATTRRLPILDTCRSCRDTPVHHVRDRCPAVLADPRRTIEA